MIRTKDLLPLLRASSKIFDEIANIELRQSHFTLWKDERGNLSYYTILGDYASHIITSYKAKKISDFDNIFKLIEQLHVNGDDYIKNAATIGVLEGIQNIADNSSLDPEEFVKYLQPD